jgi:hypothetical protein
VVVADGDDGDEDAVLLDGRHEVTECGVGAGGRMF